MVLVVPSRGVTCLGSSPFPPLFLSTSPLLGETCEHEAPYRPPHHPTMTPSKPPSNLSPLPLLVRIQSGLAVASTRICRDTYTRQSLGYGYVNFAYTDVESVEKCIEDLNYEPLKGKPMRIMMVRRDPTLRKTGRGNIFVKNLPLDMDERSLYLTFQNVGPVLSVKVARDPKNNESRGYGFVHYEKEEDATQAIAILNGKQLDSTPPVILEVQEFRRKQDRPNAENQFTNVYVKNLPTSVDEAKLGEMCEKFGKVSKSAIMRGDDGESRGFAFVNFEDHDAALKAVEGLDGLEMDGKKIYCARAQVRYVISAVLLSVCLWTWSWSWSWITTPHYTTPHDTTHDTTRLGVVSWMV